MRRAEWNNFSAAGQSRTHARRRVYDMVVAEKLQVQGFHYPFPGLGSVVKDGDGDRVIPAPWKPGI